MRAPEAMDLPTAGDDATPQRAETNGTVANQAGFASLPRTMVQPKTKTRQGFNFLMVQETTARRRTRSQPSRAPAIGKVSKLDTTHGMPAKSGHFQ